MEDFCLNPPRTLSQNADGDWTFCDSSSYCCAMSGLYIEALYSGPILRLQAPLQYWLKVLAGAAEGGAPRLEPQWRHELLAFAPGRGSAARWRHELLAFAPGGEGPRGSNPGGDTNPWPSPLSQYCNGAWSLNMGPLYKASI